jgi:hypothetical protein
VTLRGEDVAKRKAQRGSLTTNMATVMLAVGALLAAAMLAAVVVIRLLSA